MITPPTIEWDALAPDVVLLGAASLLLLLAVAVGGRGARDLSFLIGAGAFVGSLIATAQIWDSHGGSWSVLSDQLVVDRFANAVRVIVAGSGLLTLAVAYGWPRMRERGPEFVAFLVFAAAGMDLVSAASSFVSLFVALELFSITLYALCAFDVRSEASLEAGFKYLVLGSVGSAVLLYGAALLYGATGALDLAGIAKGLRADPTAPLALAGTAMVLAGLAFKVAVVPFHMWTPDVYEGAPSPVTGFMSAATKTAAFAILYRVTVAALPAEAQYWRPALAALAIVTMIGANVAALRQTNVKRMLAYSSVGHAGYLLMAIVAGSGAGKALLFYLACYAAMSVGSFAVIAVHEREIGGPATIESLRGWGFKRPTMAASLTVFLLSLGGFPPTAGFLAKLYLFSATVQADSTYLVIVGVVATVIGLGYYLKVGLSMFDRGSESGAMAELAPGAVFAGIATVVAAGVVLWLGVYPSDVLDWAGSAAASLVAAP